VSGMSEIACESPVGIWMALLTGLYHRVVADMRVRIVDLPDIVGAVAIGALG